MSSSIAISYAAKRSAFDSVAIVSIKGLYLFACLLFLLQQASASADITADVFGDVVDVLPLAFGDFNSDKLTDVIVLRNHYSFEVMLASIKAPYLQLSGIACSFSLPISSVVPGDFDGDAAMDLLVVTNSSAGTNVYIAWGKLDGVICPHFKLFEVDAEPLVVDFNSDMISDIVGYKDGKIKVWIWGTNRTVEEEIIMDTSELRIPHSSAFVDLNRDLAADIVITGKNELSLWYYEDSRYEKKTIIRYPEVALVGQLILTDLNSSGKIDIIFPVCVDKACRNSTFMIYQNDSWINIETEMTDKMVQMTFAQPKSSVLYRDTLTGRVGDFNLDGYPDVLITVDSGLATKVALLENTACDVCFYRRKLVLRWLSDMDNTVMGTFYDIQENGILDIITVGYKSGRLEVAAFRNDGFDANFIKVIVLTGRCYSNCTHGNLPYGTNLPGPTIIYKTTRYDGGSQISCASQLSQSAHLVMQLPYTVFGLGRTPNFIEHLEVGLTYPDPGRRRREWTQIIPNSQMMIIPNLIGQPRYWLNKLFVTPSNAIVLSACALAGFGGLLAIFILVLQCREKKLDKQERLKEAHKFHFDAM
uniref:EOG090X03KG n=1 Tax=Lynceus sp. MCZ IZ 141354 TaxID=1930659 RepID=A0A9N6WSU5_9CRUS|nr:EOG090X03KG [Lynceus sp. MCZ IZ 141354]